MPRKHWWIAPLEAVWANLMEKYSVLVCRYPWPFIIIPTIITLSLSSGIFLDFKIVRGVKYLYSPLNAEWKNEEAVLIDNWSNDDEHFYPGKDVTRRRGLYLIIQAKDGGSILRSNHSKEVLDVLQWVSSSRFSTDHNISISYQDVCLTFQNECFSNSHVKLIAKVFANKHQESFNITFPTFRSQFITEPMDLSKTLGNAKLDMHGYLESATTWLLLYQMKNSNVRWNQMGSLFENAVAKAIETKKYPGDLLEIFYFHSDTFDQELGKENKRITPMFSLTFTVLIIFSILCTFIIKWIEVPPAMQLALNLTPDMKIPLIDWVLSKPWMGVVGVVSALMAIISSTGLLLLLKVQFVDMCTVMPFLSLTIGIDDTFLMLAAWHDTDRHQPYENRIRQTMRHAAVSISITSLTDALAFMIGAIAPLPAVMYFCYYSCAAICFIFLYCVTIFTAFLSLQARWEEESKNSVIGTKVIPFEKIEKEPISKILFNSGSKSLIAKEENNNGPTQKVELKDERMWYQRFFEDIYGPFIIRKEISILAFLGYIAYAVITFYGIKQLIVGFDLIHIVQKDSLSRRFLETRQSLFPEDLLNLDIAIMSPPNMANATERKQFLKALEEIETTFCSQGKNSTAFWYFAFQRYLDELGFGLNFDELVTDQESFYENLRGFLLANEKWSYDVHWKSDNNSLQNFRLATRLANVSRDIDIFECSQIMRKISNSHSNFNITSYTPLWNIADQYDIMWPQTMQDLLISIAVMVPISLLFIPQPLCSLVIAANIASIALGVIGFMTYWGVNLDATSMITIAMSVGFSVDFAAHVSYAYMTESSEESKYSATTRLCKTLGSVGWPVAQACFSVLLGVSSLSFVDSYVVQTCFKTVVLVISSGTIHALLFLPLVLYYVHKFSLCTTKRKEDSQA